MKMARITDGIVGDVIVPIDGFRIEECFHPDLLAQYVAVDGDVQPGWIVTEDGIVAPEPEAPAEEAPAEEAPEAVS
jgi:hypothetical protein